METIKVSLTPKEKYNLLRKAILSYGSLQSDGKTYVIEMTSELYNLLSQEEHLENIEALRSELKSLNNL